MSYPGQDISGAPRIAIQWSLALLVASCVVREQHVLASALSLWPARRIGIVSYGIYLYHMLVRHGVDKAMRSAGLQSRWLFFVATALGTWLVAEASYRWFESRFLALKARWS
jgi:peptidoglycan/LPS O-acetylase OafA/YrhL